MIEGLVPYSDDEAATSDSDSDALHQSPADKPFINEPAAASIAAVRDDRPAKRMRHGAADGGPPSALTLPGSTLQGLRQFPHQEGQFATTVFIPDAAPQQESLPFAVRFDAAQQAAMQTTYDQLLDHAPALQVAAWTGAGAEEQAVPAEQHISVSRTVALRYSQVEEVIGSLRHRLRNLSRFEAAFGDLAMLANDNASRHFVCLTMDRGTAETCAIIKAVNKTLRTNGLRTFHEVPRPHVSVGWVLSDGCSTVEAAVARLNAESAQQLEAPSLTAMVERVCCQVGQKQYTLWPAP